MALSRRRPFGPPQLHPLVRPLSDEEKKEKKKLPPNIGYWTEEALANLSRFLRDLYHASEGGLPAGGSTITPSLVKAGVSGDVGLLETGWTPGSHAHGVLTAAPGAITLGTVAAEGTSSALARSDHVHDTVALQSQLTALIEDEVYLSWVM